MEKKRYMLLHIYCQCPSLRSLTRVTDNRISDETKEVLNQNAIEKRGAKAVIVLQTLEDINQQARGANVVLA